MNLTVKSASLLDITKLVFLYNQIYEDYYLPLQHNLVSIVNSIKVLDLNLALSQVLYVDDIPVGLALIGQRGSQAWLYSFGIIRTYRRLGLGGFLLQDILDRCVKNKIKQIGLEVLIQNTEAKHLYETVGFQRVSYLDAYTTTYLSYKTMEETWPIKPLAWPQLQEFRERDVLEDLIVWSRRWETICHSRSMLLGLYARNELQAVVAYRVKGAVAVDRLIIREGNDFVKVGSALLRQVQCENPQCLRINFLNISNLDEQMINFVTTLNMKRFMRQELLLKHFN